MTFKVSAEPSVYRFQRSCLAKVKASSHWASFDRDGMEGAYPHLMDLETLLAPYAESVRASFVAYLHLHLTEPFDLSPVHQQRLASFVELAGITEGMSTEARQARVDRYFDEHPLPPELLAAFGLAIDEVERSAADGARAAAIELGAVTLSSAPPSRPKGAPPGGHLNVLLARSFRAGGTSSTGSRGSGRLH